MNQHPLFSIGFRPFFLFASLVSIALIAIWIGFYYYATPLPSNYYSPSIWHAHEMIFGYSIAIIAGFLLTAIASWTGLTTVSGYKLTGLVGVWVLARIAPFLPFIPKYIIAITDFIFLPMLCYFIANPLIRSSNKRNYFIIVLIFVFSILNGLIHLNILNIISINSSILLSLALYLIITLIIVMAGRVFPMFSQNGVDNRYTAKKYPLIEKLAVPSFILFALVDLVFRNSWIILCTASITALIHATRLFGWYNSQIWQKPLVWVLHLGYGFLILSLLLSSLKGFYPLLSSPSLHLFTVGVIGLLTLGMIARVSLGHTGRDLQHPPALLKWAFLALIISAFIRVFVPIVFPSFYLESLLISGTFWILAFLMFLLKYFNFLIQPRLN